jgi:PS-10 peptidase S37
MGPFQWWVMLDIDLYVRFLGRRQMFLYGENDPWGAERFEPGPHATDSRVFTAPDANHGARVVDLAPADRDAAIATIRRWAGLPPLAAQGLAALKGRLEEEPSLDYVERMSRIRRRR